MNADVRNDLRTALKVSMRLQAPPDMLQLAALCRVIPLASVIITQVVAALAPNTLVHQAVVKAGPLGWVCVWALCAVALLGVVETLCNDVLAGRWLLPTVYRERHWLYLLTAGGTLSTAFVIAEGSGATPVLIRYLFDASALFAIAWVDAIARHRKAHVHAS